MATKAIRPSRVSSSSPLREHVRQRTAGNSGRSGAPQYRTQVAGIRGQVFPPAHLRHRTYVIFFSLFPAAIVVAMVSSRTFGRGAPRTGAPR